MKMQPELWYLLAGAEEACWAHNPKVPGSKPGRATSFGLVRYLLDLSQNRDISTRTICIGPPKMKRARFEGATEDASC